MRKLKQVFEVQSNERACRKSGRLGMDQVISQKVLGFTSMEGGRSTELGVPYLYLYPKNYSSVYICPIIFHHVIGRYFSSCNAIDNHNRTSQSNVALEKILSDPECLF